MRSSVLQSGLVYRIGMSKYLAFARGCFWGDWCSYRPILGDVRSEKGGEMRLTSRCLGR